MKTDLMLNATALSRLACDRRYQVQCLWGYDIPSSPEAGFGSEFHKFAEYLEANERSPEIDLVEYFTKVNPSQDKSLMKLCHYYSQVNPFKGIPPLALEYKFAFPYLETSDYRIILCGTIDRIDMEDGNVRIIDRKTSRETKIQDVLSRYELHIQIPFYQWIVSNFLTDFLSEKAQTAIRKNRIIGQYHGIFLSFNPVKFELGKIIALTYDMEKDINNMISLAAARMIELHKLGSTLATPTGMAHQACRYCLLNNLCITRNHRDILRFLEGLTPKPYDPRTWR
jgi:hypothetical protein